MHDKPTNTTPRDRVYKWTLDPKGPEGSCEVMMPIGARLLHVGAQGTDLCLWAQVTVNATQHPRTFYVVGTGHDMPRRNLEHIGTALLYEGSLVLHVFEEVCF